MSLRLCKLVQEDVEHVFSYCPRCTDAFLRLKLSPEFIVEEMLASETTCNAVIDYAAHVTSEKG